jgi:hypothetical protein
MPLFRLPTKIGVREAMWSLVEGQMERTWSVVQFDAVVCMGEGPF